MRGFVARVVVGLALLAVMAGAAQAAGSPNVVVSEFRTRGVSASDEFVELYNRSNAPVDISGYKVQGSNATAGVSTRATIPAGKILNPGCHYLLTNVTAGGGYTGSVAGDQTYSTGITDDGGIAVTLPSGAIVDAVGMSSGSAYKEGTTLAPITTAGNKSYERKPGGALGNGADTDNNASDFQLISPSAPQNLLSPCIGSTSPTDPTGTGAATPSSVEPGDDTLLTVSVQPGTNPTSTGLVVSANTTSIGVTSPQQLFDDGTHGDATAGDGTFSCLVTVAPGTATGAKTIPATITDDQHRTGSAPIALTVIAPTPITHIHAIQGAAQVSPLAGQPVTNVRGIVTGVRGNGFYFQDPDPDADPATSEGLFVFTSSAPNVQMGDLVRVDGRVSEFVAFVSGQDAGFLPVTELSGSPTVSVLAHGRPLPAPVIPAPPTAVVENDSTGDIRTDGNVFDPSEDAIDYWESLEGMRVEIDNPVAVGPQNSFGELPVLANDGAGAALRTPRGGVLLTPATSNPQRLILDDLILPTPPNVNVGDHFDGPAIGVMDYTFGNFSVEITQPLTRVDSGLQKEATAPAGPDELSIATFNVQNLAPSDGAAKFDGLANRIVNNLRSPKIITVEEVQDNSGATDNGVVNSDDTVSKLVAAIEAAGGPRYSSTYIAPVNDQDGGRPGGNIRIVFLYDEAAGVSLAPAPKGGSTEPESVTTDTSGAPHLALNPGRVDPTNSAWNSSRKPLAAEFLYRGQTFFVIGNHFNSKGGDDPLMGRFQPPTRSSEVQRHQQAQIVHDFVGSILAQDAHAKIVVLGDLNDFQFSDTVHILEAGILNDMIDTLPENERYSYEFEGNAQVLDHILASDGVTDPSFDVVHINAEFADQVSDHDPSVLRVLVNDAPAVSAGGPYTVAEGGTTTLTGTATDRNGDPLTYAWDLNGDGVTDAAGPVATFDASSLDGPSDVDVAVTVSDGIGSTTEHATVHVTNVAPTAALSGAPASSPEGSPLSATGAATDPAAADTLSYAWTVTKDGAPYASGTGTDVAFTPDDNGTYVIAFTATDDDGGTDTASATTDVTNVAPTASVAAPAASMEGAAVTASASATDPGSADGTPAFAWSVTKNGAAYANGTGAAISYTPDDDGTYVVSVTATDKDGGAGTASATTQVTNVAPTATFNAPSSAVSGSTFSISLSNPADASPVDAGSLQFAFDCGSGFGAYGSARSASCTAAYDGTQTVAGRVRDKDGGVTAYTATVHITVTVDSVCALVQRLAKNAGQANSLCVKLQHGQIAAFDHEVDAQAGKAFTAADAALLERLAAQL